MEKNYHQETNNNLNRIKAINENINKKYYSSVLKLFKKIFNTDSNSLLKIKITLITLNIEIFKFYNKIINKFNLNKQLFDIDNFNIELLNTNENLMSIVMILCNNLLEKINYKLIKIKFNDVVKLKIVSE
jgi:hypothetical protein